VIKLKNPTLQNQSWIFIKRIYFLLADKIKVINPDLIRYSAAGAAIFYIVPETNAMFLSDRSIWQT
jgi:hypothetical protein